jgi:hypothetical protein
MRTRVALSSRVVVGEKVTSHDAELPTGIFPGRVADITMKSAALAPSVLTERAAAIGCDDVTLFPRPPLHAVTKAHTNATASIKP